MYEGRRHIQIDITTWRTLGLRPDVVLAAPPCTDFASSGARWFAAKDADGRTEASLRVIEATLELIRGWNPRIWALENPVGRLARLVPQLGKPKLRFDPCDYGGWLTPPGDNYTKKTCLWGEFVAPEVRRVEPEFVTTPSGAKGSWLWANLGGKSDRTKYLRSVTPSGFAKAFAAANAGPVAR